MARRRQVASVGPEQPFKGRQFTAEVILRAVRWYLMFPISYRDLALMLQDRGVAVDHTMIFRWIQAYAPELEKRIRPHLRPTNGSWRVDESVPQQAAWVKSPSRERYGKGVARRQVGDRKANTSELPFKCRKLSDDVKTGGFRYAGISLDETCLRARWRPA